MSLTDGAPEEAGAPADVLAAVDYSHVPHIPRRWLWDGYIPVGTPVVYAGKGGVAKGHLLVADVARVVLGLPFPGDDQTSRPAPRRVVWITGPGEDDQFEDLAPRFRAGIAAAVAEFGLDPELAGEHGAISRILDLSQWRDNSPVSLPADCPRILAELSALNRAGEGRGLPTVGMVVADSLSALLSDGYTIDSRQGARRVMGALSRFARKADVAFPVIHHLTKDGKVAGSPAVLDAVRLAFVIEFAKDGDEGVRLIKRHKSNISDAEPQGYIVTGHGAGVHAEFVTSQDMRLERVARAAESAAEAPAPAPADVPEPGSFRARMESAVPVPGMPWPETLSRLAADVDPGPFAVLRGVRPADAVDNSRDVRKTLGRDYPTRADAWRAVTADCGTVLRPVPMPDDPRGQMAGAKLADGSRLSYVVKPS